MRRAIANVHSRFSAAFASSSRTVLPLLEDEPCTPSTSRGYTTVAPSSSSLSGPTQPPLLASTRDHPFAHPSKLSPPERRSSRSPKKTKASPPHGPKAEQSSSHAASLHASTNLSPPFAAYASMKDTPRPPDSPHQHQHQTEGPPRLPVPRALWAARRPPPAELTGMETFLGHAPHLPAPLAYSRTPYPAPEPAPAFFAPTEPSAPPNPRRLWPSHREKDDQREAYHSLGATTRDGLLAFLTPAQLLFVWKRLRAGATDRGINRFFRKEVWPNEVGDGAGNADPWYPLKLKDMYVAVGRTNLWERRLKAVLYKCLLDEWRRVYMTRKGIKSWNYSDLSVLMALSRFRVQNGDPYGALDFARLLHEALKESLHSPKADQPEEVARRAELAKTIESTLQTVQKLGLVEAYPLMARMYTQGIVFPQNPAVVEGSLRMAVKLGALDAATTLASHFDKMVPAGILGHKPGIQRPLPWSPRFARIFYQIAAPTGGHPAYQAGRFYYRKPTDTRQSHIGEYRVAPDDIKSASYFWMAHEALHPDATWRLAEMLILDRAAARGALAAEGSAAPGARRRGRLRTAIALIGWVAQRDKIIRPQHWHVEVAEERRAFLDQPAMFSHAFTFRSPIRSGLVDNGPPIVVPNDLEEALWQEREEIIRAAAKEAIEQLPEHLRPRTGRNALELDPEEAVAPDDPEGDADEWNTVVQTSESLPAHLRWRDRGPAVERKEEESDLNATPFFKPEHVELWTGAPDEPETGAAVLPAATWYEHFDLSILRGTRFDFLLPMLRVARGLLEEVERGGRGMLLGEEGEAEWVGDYERHRVGDRRERERRRRASGERFLPRAGRRMQEQGEREDVGLGQWLEGKRETGGASPDGGEMEDLEKRLALPGTGGPWELADAQAQVPLPLPALGETGNLQGDEGKEGWFEDVRAVDDWPAAGKRSGMY
ncbi:hypothetical protein CALVIDRAFT_558335 [Calocera viscosa TUFC12733]|uniref:Uncharacterized protein n=1 Tax=Calocera viscosa (strain TUFC12733) TaxID=1330018 RepID=A0A167GZ21_CALVF|nr:hypothetical protein CALVIDRAFT_558335 [Calocera viscosa TUFC12733]